MISIVIPIYNEAKNIPCLFNDIIKKVSYRPLEFIFIDDGSLDNSWQVIKNLYPPKGIYIKAIRFTRNFGKEAAILAGLREAKGEAIIVMDADGQHPPEYIPEMIRWWQKGYDLVELVKTKRQRENLIKRLGVYTFYRIFRRFSGIDLENLTDFKLLSRHAVNLYLDLPERRRFFRGLMEWLGVPSKRLPFCPPDRQHGSSSWNFLRLWDLSWSSIVSFSIWPLRLLTCVGGLGCLFSLILICQTIYKKFTKSSLEGFPTVIILISLFSSLILLGLGIIGEYIGQIYEEIKRRPPYIILEKFER